MYSKYQDKFYILFLFVIISAGECMKREDAIRLLDKHLNKENLIKHSLAVEACMIELARYFRKDKDLWGITGLLHDLDYNYTADSPETHGLKTAEILQPFNLNKAVIHAIKAHNNLAERRSYLDIALYAVDPTTGFIIACALIHPSRKLENIDLKRMKKRFSEKKFARGADRDQISACCEMGFELDDFLLLCLKAMSEINRDLVL
jgi:putative nucleotidyltransferase with HDIG domain